MTGPGNCREYVYLRHRLRGASCAGIDASARLIAVARDRNPDCDIRVGDMPALPWEPASSGNVVGYLARKPEGAQPA